MIFALRGAAAYEAFAAALSAGEPAPTRPVVATSGTADMESPANPWATPEPRIAPGDAG